jgi:hypothetical protein
MGRIPDKQSPLVDAKKEFYRDGGTEDDTFYEEPPCMCAQQIISTLFGSILGYLALLLSPRNIYFPIAFMQVGYYARCLAYVSKRLVFIRPVLGFLCMSIVTGHRYSAGVTRIGKIECAALK